MEHKDEEITKAVFSSKNVTPIDKIPSLSRLLKYLPKNPFKFIEQLIRHYLFFIRLLIGWIIWALGVFFFFYTLADLIFYFNTNIDLGSNHIKDGVKIEWYIKILEYIDRFFIFLTIIVIGERATTSTYQEAKIYIVYPNVKLPFSYFDFDKPLAGMVVITLSISFLTLALKGTTGQEIFLNGVGIGLIIIAIGVWSFLDNKGNQEAESKNAKSVKETRDYPQP